MKKRLKEPLRFAPSASGNHDVNRGRHRPPL